MTSGNMESIQCNFGFGKRLPGFEPASVLTYEFQLRGEDLKGIQAIETSVLWHTIGKGDEDIGVHFFNRYGKRELAERDLSVVFEFSTELPKSPHSYLGQIVSIEWLVRVKLFLNRGKPLVFDHPIRLGAVLSADRLGSLSNLDRYAEGDVE